VKSHKIVIENERPLSWNQLYSGKHWSVRKDEADRVHWLVKANLDPEVKINGLVDITLIAYFDKYALDADNISAKFYIDGLVGEWIEDDRRAFVRRVCTQSEIDRDNPRVEIVVTEID